MSPRICTVTSSATPPVGSTFIVYCAVCPGSTVVAVACALTQSSVDGGDEEDDEDADEDLAPDDVLAPPGVTVGVGPGGGELGDVGSVAHTLFPAFKAPAWVAARATAVVPAHSTAVPAKAAKTVYPARLLRRGTTGRDGPWGVNSRFSIMG